MTDKPQSINGWEFQTQTENMAMKKLLAHWQLNRHLYENASKNLKGLWLLRLAIHWWGDPAMREHQCSLIEQNDFRGIIDMMEFYSKAVGVEL